jgi:hypothetical protein
VLEVERASGNRTGTSRKQAHFSVSGKVTFVLCLNSTEYNRVPGTRELPGGRKNYTMSPENNHDSGAQGK